MTNREAIEQLKFDMEMILFNPNTGEKLTPEQVKLRNEDNYKTYLADQMAITALEKQEPVKPEKIEPCNNGLRFGWCPKCGYSQVCETADYCKTCGQRLTWEDTE